MKLIFNTTVYLLLITNAFSQSLTKSLVRNMTNGLSSAAIIGKIEPKYCESSDEDINCDFDENREIKLDKETHKVRCNWINEQGETVFLFEKFHDKKAREIYARVINKNGSHIDIPISINTRAHIENREDGLYLVKYDTKNGKRLISLISSNTKWLYNPNWEYDPKENHDPDRKLLRLQTHDGIDFYSFYYLPENYKSSQKNQVVVLLGGGTGAFKNETDKENYIDKDTVDFLRKSGYTVLLANFRGKQRLSNKFRQTGPGHMHDHGIKDIVTSLDSLNAQVPFIKDKVKVIGHSRGGHMAALLATRLKEISNNYKIEKTIVSSGVFNPIDGYYNFYDELSNKINPDKNLDFVDDDWTNGALGYRPLGKFTDSQWQQIQEIEKDKFERFRRNYYNKEMPLFNTQAYFDQSPYHHTDGLQGQVLALVGENESGNTAAASPLQFQKKVGEKKMQTIVHKYGHGFTTKSQAEQVKDEDLYKEIDFWENHVLSFLGKSSIKD